MRILGTRLGMGLVFAFCIWSVSVLTVEPVLGWMKSADWVPQAAVLERAETIKISSQGSSWRLVAEYSYNVNGENFTGSRVTVYPRGLSMPRSLQLSLLAQFKEQDKQQSLIVYINPDNPAESTLTNDFLSEWYLRNIYTLVIMLYAAFGFFCLLRLVGNSAKAANPQGEQGELADSQSGSDVWKFLAYLAGFFTLLSGGIVNIILASVRVNDYGALAFIMFPLATLFLWWLTRYAWVERNATKSGTC